ERARFSIQRLEAEKASAESILAEIVDKVDKLRREYEEQKKITAELQQQADSIRRVQREKQEESFQINKAVEMREIEGSSLKQELEKHATDTTKQSDSLAEFENKLKLLQRELDDKNAEQEELQKEEERVQGLIVDAGKTIEMIREELNVTGRKLEAQQNE